uniref:Uncharacterized protein n=1 Tax=Acrobeloides nanus TaxID=290746 RepID=A0A914ELJ2_9BILA
MNQGFRLNNMNQGFRPNNMNQGENPRLEWMRSLIGAGGPQIHPVSAGHPFSATDVVFIPQHLLEEPFPPKYEDAIKMRSPSTEVATTPRRPSITTIHPVTPAPSPPPLYEEEATPREENHVSPPPPSIELPPNYSSPNLSATLARHRNSLTIDRPTPMFSAARQYRRSLGDAYLDVVPENEDRGSSPTTSSSPRRSSLTIQQPTFSAQNSRPSSSDRPTTSTETRTSSHENLTIQEAPRRVSIDMSSYEAPLPGAVTDETPRDTSDSPPMLNTRRNSDRRFSCLTISDLNVQTL